MDDRRFDLLAQRLASGLDRRTLTAALGAALAGVGVAAAGEAAGAKGKGRRGRGKHGGHRDHGGGGDQRGGGAAGGDAVAPAKKKKCKNGTTKCGKKCRDLTSDSANCGACGHACGSGEGCVGGACAGGCGAGQTRCGGSCVNTQTDEANCGSCGHACDGGESCQGSQCQTTTCGAGQIRCGNGCVATVGDHPCCSQAECGEVGSYNFIHCDLTTHQCVCDDVDLGICQRYDDGRGRCAPCCPGANPGNCLGDHACRGEDFCACPPGQTSCDARQCYVDWSKGGGDEGNPRQCGTSCDDCTHNGTTPYVCCWRGTCNPAGGFGPSTSGSRGTYCGGCTRCPETDMCCNLGPGTEPRCVADVASCPTP